MRRPVFVLALFATLVAPAVVAPQPALACSATEFVPVRDTEVIVLAYVTDMRLPPEHEGFGTGEPVAVWVDLEVDEYLKGAGATSVSALDTSSVVFLDGQSREEQAAFEGAQYWGASGSCGSLIEDPRGKYWLTGLTVKDGVYRLNLITSAFGALARDRDDPHLLERLETVRAGLAEYGVTPAGTGHGVAPGASGVPAGPWMAPPPRRAGAPRREVSGNPCHAQQTAGSRPITAAPNSPRTARRVAPTSVILATQRPRRRPRMTPATHDPAAERSGTAHSVRRSLRGLHYEEPPQG